MKNKLYDCSASKSKKYFTKKEIDMQSDNWRVVDEQTGVEVGLYLLYEPIEKVQEISQLLGHSMEGGCRGSLSHGDEKIKTKYLEAFSARTQLPQN